MTPRILAITNEDPAWPEADKQQGDDAWQALVSGIAEEGYECRAFKFFDDLRFLDDFDPREWLVWNWGEELAGRPWSDAEVADELERRGFAYTGASARLHSPDAGSHGREAAAASRRASHAAGSGPPSSRRRSRTGRSSPPSSRAHTSTRALASTATRL